MTIALETLSPSVSSAQWAEALGEAMRIKGTWPVLHWLGQRRQESPDDLRVRGYIEIVRNAIVRDFMHDARGLDSVPKLTPEFLSDYGRFNLSAQEGYLVSLIDGRISLQRTLKLSPFDPFSTMFCFARLRHLGAITV